MSIKKGAQLELLEKTDQIQPVKVDTISQSEMIKIVLTLLLTTLVVGGLITVTNFYTQPIINDHKNQKARELATIAGQLNMVKKVIPSAEHVDKIGVWEINEQTAEYFCAQKEGKIIGYAIVSFGKGYSSLIKILIGVDNKFQITGLEVLYQAETPGLGTEIVGNDFRKQFIGRNISSIKVSTTGEDNCIQAITGATISSKAVVEDALKNALNFIQVNL